LIESFVNFAETFIWSVYYLPLLRSDKMKYKVLPKLKGYEFSENRIEKARNKENLLLLLLAYNENCNLECPFCFTGHGTKARSELEKQGISAELLTPDELEGLIDQGKKLGIESVCFYGEGEPLLNKDLFFRLVDHCNKENITPVVFTNGTLVDIEIAKKLFDNNVSVVGKLYSLNSKVNEYLTGNKGIYKYITYDSVKVSSHIKFLLEVGFANTDRFALDTVVTSKNYSEIPCIWQWERENGIIPYADFLYLPGRNSTKLDVSKEEREELCKKIWELDKKLGYHYPLQIGPKLGNRKCDARATLVIGAHGIARLCAATYVFVGNVRDEPLKSILKRQEKIKANVGWGCDKGCVYCDAYRQTEHLYNP